VEECRAHNLEVGGSKPPPAIDSFLKVYYTRTPTHALHPITLNSHENTPILTPLFLHHLTTIGGVAQWKSAGLITWRSEDRNLPPPSILFERVEVYFTKLHPERCIRRHPIALNSHENLPIRTPRFLHHLTTIGGVANKRAGSERYIRPPSRHPIRLNSDENAHILTPLPPSSHTNPAG
jgi:hypothetical protein